jgi:amino acid permease
MIEIYKQPKFKYLRIIGIVLSIFAIVAAIFIWLFEASIELGLFAFIYPISLFISSYFDHYYPYISLNEDTLTKRLFFKKYKIQVDEIEYVKNVFGDVHVKGPDKIIQVEKDVVRSEDMQQLLDLLEGRTALKPV